MTELEEEQTEEEYFSANGSVRLTREQEAELFERFQAGDQRAGAVLVESIKPWVTFIVKKQAFGFGWSNQEDERESAVGLAIAKSLASFDPTKGKLTTHSYWQTRAVCCRQSEFTQVVATPSINGDQRYYEASQRSKRCKSLDATLSGDYDQTLGETLSYQGIQDVGDLLDLQLQRKQLRWALNRMGDLDAEVLRMRFLEGLTLEEAGKRLGVTRERVRQREARGLKRLTNLIEQAPSRDSQLLDQQGQEFELDGLLGPGSHLAETTEPLPQVEENDIMAGRTLTQLLRELTVADVDRELQQLEANCGEQIDTYQADRRRLRLLRELLGSRKAPPSPVSRPPARNKLKPGRIPQMFPREGTNAELIYTLLLSTGTLPVATIALKTKFTQGQVNAVLTRYRDRFFVRRKIGWAAISKAQVEESWRSQNLPYAVPS